MANEYLKRTPTSTGNRKVWTLALWLKRNAVFGDTGADVIFNAANTAANSHGTDIRFRKDNSSGSNNGWNFYDYVNNSFPWTKYGDIERRDSGNWFHAMFVFDSTKPRGDDRVEVYINGVLDTAIMGTYDTNPSANYETYVNSITEHYLGIDQFGGSLTTSYSKSQFSDVFLVDGQALTPDVFGFYKDGKGYQSSGSTKATDFRPGQWSPHSPRKIKTEIERNGGFGVNGFYLPMNDSSNVGADFHCTPNSIIKLKGEDLPQPRNGAPTTSDTYVSQLREDPYAANLVLAVPGIALENNNPELITNGTFDTNTTGWTLGTNSISSVVDGVLRARSTVSDLHNQTYQDVTTVIGTRYTVSATVKIESGGQPAWLWIDGNSVVSSTSTSYVTISYDFTATSTTTKVGISERLNTYTYYDNISLKVAKPIRDYSADIKGSGTNKTLTPNGAAGVGYEIPSYYGSAMRFDNDGTNGAGNADIINVPTSSDFVFNGDVTIECWMYLRSTPTTSGAFLGQWQSGGGTNRNLMMYLDSSNRITSYFNSGGTNYNTGASPTLALNQWHHIATEKDGSNFRLYLNGVCVSTNVNTPTAGNTSAVPFTIGAETESGGTTTGADYGIDGYIQDVRVYKDLAKYKGGFDVPKPYTPVGIESWRQVSDTCKNNFATLNPLSYQTTGTYGSSVPALTNGNLTYTHGQGGQWERSNSTMGVSEGKWYFEFEVVTRPVTGNTENWAVGLRESDSSSFYGETDGFEDLGDHVYWIDAGTAKIVSNQDRSAGSTSGITAAANGDIINIAFEKTATALKVWFGKNGTYFNSGNPATGSNPAVNHSTTSTFIIPAVAYYRYSGQEQPVATFNFGQNPAFSGTKIAGTYTDSNGKGLFKYQPPTDFLALCEDNLPTPAIADPGEHFKTVIYRGTGSSRAVTGVGFKPDFIWCKSRTNTEGHIIFDSIRGPEKRLLAMGTQTESTSSGGVMSFDDDGYSTKQYTGTNQSGQDYVAWCWKAGGAAVTNTDGTITSQVSANQTAGFSIVSYTGTGSAGTVGHGLGKAPSLIITKHRAGTSLGNVNWNVCTSLVPGGYLELNTTVAHNPVTDRYVTAGTNTNSFPGGYVHFNDSNRTYISYCWAEIEGYSKFGSYTGNGNIDGPFVYCGFKPAFLMIKRTDTTGEWWMYDSSRGSTNPIPRMLMANSASIEQEDSASYLLDFVSNGFKWRSGLAASNGNGGSFIFMAIAESPFQTANAK